MNNNSDTTHDQLKAITTILKHNLVMMMTEKWNGKRFDNLNHLHSMADDVLEVLGEMGNNFYE